MPDKVLEYLVRSTIERIEENLPFYWGKATGAERKRKSIGKILEVCAETQCAYPATREEIETKKALLEATIIIDPNNVDAIAALAEHYRSYDQNPELAMERCIEGLKIKPRHPQCLGTLGQCYFQIGEKDKALECFRKALKYERPDGHYAQYLHSRIACVENPFPEEALDVG